MAWTVKYLNASKMIEIVLTGKNAGPDLREMTSKAIAMSKEEDTLICLVDATDVELAASLLDLLDLPADQYKAEGLIYAMRVALVLPTRPEEKQNAQFYETACINRGRNVKSFPNRAEAIKWLASKAPPDRADAKDK